MSNIVIAAAKRTAIGSFLGQFNGVPTPTLGAAAIAAERVVAIASNRPISSATGIDIEAQTPTPPGQ